MVFGINACYGRTGASKPMDMSNLQALLDLTVTLPKEHLKHLIGFEFGNEIEPQGVSWAQWAADANTLSRAINATFSKAGLAPRPVIGPDVQLSADGWKTVMRAAAPGVLAALTYHQYPQCEPPPHGAALVLDPACLAQLGSTARAAAALGGPGGFASWSGEGAVHSATGGNFGVWMGTFRSSFYYAWLLGTLPADGVAVAVRQAFIGGNYGLLNRTTRMPTPDYWIAFAFRSLFSGAPPYGLGGTGAPVAAVPGGGADTGLHAAAFRGASGGSCLVVLINLLTRGSQTVALEGVAGSGGGVPRQRTEWHFTGSGGAGANATEVDVNGRAVAFAPGASLPVFADLGRKVSDADASVNLAPASIAFVLVS